VAFCTACGSALPGDSARFCIKCGAPLNDADPTTVSTEVALVAQESSSSDGPDHDDDTAGYDVHLTDSGRKKIPIIKTIRTHTGFPLRDAKAIADHGGRLGLSLSQEQAANLAATLQAHGASVEIISSDGSPISVGEVVAESVARSDPRITDLGFLRLRGRVRNAVLESLRQDEPVIVVVRGAHGQAMVGTDTRVFVCKPGFMAGATLGAEVTTWQYRNLAGVQIHKGMMTGAVILQGPGQSGHSASYWRGTRDDPRKAPNAIPVAADWGEVKASVTRLQSQLDQAHRDLATPPVPSPAVLPTAGASSIADEIRKLAELRDAGVLDETEFAAAKQRLIDGR
jgi:ribosomal protein L7/L12